MFVNCPISKIFNFSKVLVRFLKSHSNLTSVSTVELWRYLSNINVIYNSWSVCLKIQENNGTEEIGVVTTTPDPGSTEIILAKSWPACLNNYIILILVLVCQMIHICNISEIEDYSEMNSNICLNVIDIISWILLGSRPATEYWSWVNKEAFWFHS